jgi:hypothetical protein
MAKVAGGTFSRIADMSLPAEERKRKRQDKGTGRNHEKEEMGIMTDRIRWEPTGRGGFTGHVGTLAGERWLFQIWNATSVGGVWQLDSALPGGFKGATGADDPDDLKAEAECLLAEFVSSLGAIFPDAALRLADQWKQFAARGDAQDECADELRETIAAALNASGTAEEIVAASIEQQSAYRNELRHLPGYMSS